MARMGSYLHWGHSHTTKVTVETHCVRASKTPYIIAGIIVLILVNGLAAATFFNVLAAYLPIIAYCIGGSILIFGITKAVLEIKQRPARIKLQEQIRRTPLASEISQVGLPKRSTIHVKAERLPTQLRR